MLRHRLALTGAVPALFTRRRAFLVAGSFLLTTCSSPGPKIEFTRVPPADKGGPDAMDVIEGKVTGAKPGQEIVVFARSEVWWAEPRLGRLFTEIKPDGTWKTQTHLGTEYAAALVNAASYRPPFTSEILPRQGGSVAAIAVVPGTASSRSLHHTLNFSGYQWNVRASPSDRGGKNSYDPANAWVDSSGAMHLRIAGEPGNWTCAQVILTRSLGYGTYRFVVRDIAKLDPAAVLAMYTLSDAGAASQNRNPREWDVEFSRWGDPKEKNARYMLQPSYLGQNTIPFEAPPGLLTHVVRWDSSSVRMTTLRRPGPESTIAAEHNFTSSIPIPGDEKFRINFYDFQRGPQLLREGAEVVIEKFEYLP
jgi:hypothetical protein